MCRGSGGDGTRDEGQERKEDEASDGYGDEDCNEGGGDDDGISNDGGARRR